MIIDFLNELEAELLEKKFELESRKNSLKIKLNENDRFIQRLSAEAEQNFNAFSPRNQNVKLKKSIKDLEEEKEVLLAEFNDVNSKLEDLTLKLEKYDLVLKSVKEQKKDQLYSSELDYSIFQKIEDIIRKLEFCSKIVLIDSSRCKMEISSTIKMLYDILDEIKNVNLSEDAINNMEAENSND